MHRFLVALLLLMVVPPVTAGAGQAFGADRAGWQTACDTYDNRARFMRRDGDVAFALLMAEACRGAFASLDSGRPAERDAAARLLTRISALRDMIVQLTVDKAYGAGGQPALTARGARPMARVSATGEYLIAREMGVIDAIASWVGTGAPFSLAAR